MREKGFLWFIIAMLMTLVILLSVTPDQRLDNVTDSCHNVGHFIVNDRLYVCRDLGPYYLTRSRPTQAVKPPEPRINT